MSLEFNRRSLLNKFRNTPKSATMARFRINEKNKVILNKTKPAERTIPEIFNKTFPEKIILIRKIMINTKLQLNKSTLILVLKENCDLKNIRIKKVLPKTQFKCCNCCQGLKVLFG